MNALRIDRTRLLHLAIIFLQVFSVAQVVFWFIDQRSYADSHAAQIRALYTYDMQAARKLAELGAAPEDITAMFPHAEVVNGELTLKPEAMAAVNEEQSSHVRQYTAESGFFLLVLALAITVLWRGLSSEAEVRRRQDNFLAMVSHQFKTPLASLQLSLETMVMRQLSPERFQQLSQRMLDDLRRMENMVSKILDSARLDRGRIQLNKERLPLGEAVRHVLSNLEDAARRANVTFDVAIAADLDIQADAMAVDGVLRNLVENAISAMTPTAGGKIAIRARRAGARVELDVSDTGVGFEPGQGPKLFEKFFRIDNHGGRDAAGTGLGLFIVQRFMKSGDGDVKARSEGPGKGAVFTVTWPAPAEQESAAL